MDLPTPTFRPVGGVPSADASVRDATAADAPGIGQVQAAAWRSSYAELLPPATLEQLEPEALAATWREALVRPPSGAHRVLVALAAGTIVGFVAIGPAEGAGPEVGELLALVVAPAAQRAGHASRLLNAAADRLRQVGFERVVVWVLAGDDARLRFLTGAGFAADGAHRSFATVDTVDSVDTGDSEAGGDAGTVREVRLVASFEPV